MEELRRIIRDVPDFPQKGVVFKDITPLLGHAPSFRKAVETMAEPLRSKSFDLLVGIESRGFIFAAALAYQLHKGHIPVRKPGKLPAKTVQVSYELEYGSDSLEMHEDAIRPGWDGAGRRRSRRENGSDGRRVLVSHRAGLPEGPGQAVSVRRSLGPELRVMVPMGSEE